MALFDEIKDTFWMDGADYGVQPPVTDEVVREAESLLDVTLPASLVDLLRVQNGGVVAEGRSAFPTDRPTSWSEDHVPFDTLMGLGRREHMTSLLDSPYLIAEWELPSPVVLLSGDGHCWIGLDYRQCGRRGEPSVAWFDVDDNSELALARDFRSFVEGLACAQDFTGDGHS